MLDLDVGDPSLGDLVRISMNTLDLEEDLMALYSGDGQMSCDDVGHCSSLSQCHEQPETALPVDLIDVLNDGELTEIECEGDIGHVIEKYNILECLDEDIDIGNFEEEPSQTAEGNAISEESESELTSMYFGPENCPLCLDEQIVPTGQVVNTGNLGFEFEVGRGYEAENDISDTDPAIGAGLAEETKPTLTLHYPHGQDIDLYHYQKQNPNATQLIFQGNVFYLNPKYGRIVSGGYRHRSSLPQGACTTSCIGQVNQWLVDIFQYDNFQDYKVKIVYRFPRFPDEESLATILFINKSDGTEIPKTQINLKFPPNSKTIVYLDEPD